MQHKNQLFKFVELKYIQEYFISRNDIAKLKATSSSKTKQKFIAKNFQTLINWHNINLR